MREGNWLRTDRIKLKGKTIGLIMSTIVRIDQNAPRSRASVLGDLVFVAGQAADDKARI